ncbi:cytochrome P450 [Dendrothele bispora CBS 962.96]|uniref:Cytochrome P450 n=1 Tax=Dendrothele bispora (strain CBS 962.96) TaxID=1314807 RepID=A0A4S8LS55_DENBC|nr:cytochrome P450 [Dendrothele bispora CBS 962.96]
MTLASISNMPGNATLTLVLLVLSIVVRLYLHRQKLNHSHGLANLPSPKSKSWWQGNFGEAFNPGKKAWDFHMKLLKEYGAVARLDGFMGDKQIIIYDPMALHHVLVKDQASYERPELSFTLLMFGRSLNALRGDEHRKQKRVLNPVFSIAHMKDMLPIFYEVIAKLEEGLSSTFKEGPETQEIDVLSWMSRTALELIGQAGLGYSFDDLSGEAVTHPYTGVIKQFVTVSGKMWLIRLYLAKWFRMMGPSGFRRWVLDTIPWENAHKLRDMSDYMWVLSKEILAGKRKALEEGDDAVARQVGKGKDLVSILMKLNMEESSENKLDEDEILAQISLFLFAAMDTTSSALARILYLLSTRPHIQDKLRQEILEARRENKDIPYDQLVSLPYLDAICRETLRLFPPVSNIFRRAVQDTVLPLSKPLNGLDGTSISEVHIPSNTNIVISILNSNRNPAIWGPDAFEWKPERWLEPLPNEVIEARIPGIYSPLMTFNAGGRSCIGFKFSQLEMKAVLLMLISKFKFEASDKDVFWQMNKIVTPSVEGGGTRPQMPLMVSRVED